MDRFDLENRTKRFAVEVIRFSETLKPGRANDVIVRHLIESSSLIGASYREAASAESRDDLIEELNISSKEAARTEYWLELLNDLRQLPDLPPLLKEADELRGILTASVRTVRAGKPRQ
jgi:four helix bundle protein